MHVWDGGVVTKKPTALTKGTTIYTCKECGTLDIFNPDKLPAKIKLSVTKKTIKKGKSFTLTVSNLTTGDSVSSVKASNKYVKVKKVSSKKYKITAKKLGKSKITVKLKSGKKATCTVYVNPK